MREYTYIYFLVINILGYILMFIDKQKAKRNRWRIKESTLILVALAGGSPGIYLGMKSFRHKTTRAKFNFGVPTIIVIQLVIILLLQ